MRPAVELTDLAIGYRHRRRSTTVAAGLTAAAHRGELTVLLGPNGAGKSTLIRTLSGLQPALGGRVSLHGTDLTTLAPAELARRVAVVLTDRVDPGLLSARELVGLGRVPHLGLRARLGEADHAIVDWALDAVGAAQLADRPAAELSDGQRQRLLTARALAQQPGLLVLDEPTAFLDVAARASLFGLLRTLARTQQLAVLLSTHDLELALRVADRVWLLDPTGGLSEAVGEELMLSGRIAALFHSDTLRFDAASGAFAFRPGGSDDGGRAARIDAPEPLRHALARVCSREGWHGTDGPAEILVTATDPAAITLDRGTDTAVATLGELPRLLRTLPAGAPHCVPAARAAAMLAELSTVSSYFAVGTGPLDAGDWRPVAALYADAAVLAEAVAGVGRRIGIPDFRVAASTFHLGFAARLWSIGLGALAEHGLLIDLSPERLWYLESDGGIRLHLPEPVAWQGDRLDARLADAILNTHLTPLAAAVRRLGSISEQLLRGNAASAMLGAARALSRRRAPDPGAGPEAEPEAGPGWGLARRLCADERLAGTIDFDFTGDGYRRTTCCLFYRTPGAGLCTDCALDRMPRSAPRNSAKASR